MSKIMLINVTHAEESRVGIVENGQLESFEIESFSREHLKGNIYKGTVRRIHPAIEAAFVDIGADRDAFLPLDEICFRNLPGGRNGASGEKGRRRIKEVLKSGDEVLVQIIKEQFTNKPPTLSTFYSLPGRYLVLLPGSEDAGISRKIEGEERVRVREMIERLHAPPGCGIIVRTAAGFDEEEGELQRDLTYLQRLWENIRKHAETKRAPALIYREHDLVLRNIRDYFTPDITEIFIDNEEVFERAKDFLHNVMPGKEHLLHLYQGEQPIFSRFGLETQIESIYKRRVQLRSGGSIVIDGTEALTAIDVNSGGSMRGGSQEETAHKTNLEAAAEIGRQLRLRDLGGIVVIDFIDMRQQTHINDVERTLREAMKPDKARHDIGRISRLGLLEVSRQRLRPAAAASSYTACPMCEGHGSVRTPESAALVALRKIHNRIAEGDVAQMRVSLPREVAMYLLNQKREDLAVFERRYAATITVVVSDKLMPHQSEIETRTRDVSERVVASVRPGEVAALEAGVPINGVAARSVSRPSEERAASGASAASTRRPASARPAREEGEATADAEGRARGRRRRGGRGRRSAEEISSTNAAPAAGAAPSPAPAAEDSAAFATSGDSGVSVAAEVHVAAPLAELMREPEVAPPRPVFEETVPAAAPSPPPLPLMGEVPETVSAGSASEAAVSVSDATATLSDGPSVAAAVADDAPSVAPSIAAPFDDPWAASLPAIRDAAPPVVAPADAHVNGASEDAAATPPRRRRRRGGKRGGRGRRGGGPRPENGAETSGSIEYGSNPAGVGAPTGDAAGIETAAPCDADGAVEPAEPGRNRGSRRRRGRVRQQHPPTAAPVEPLPES
jgi:ribonuclease E